MKIINTNIDEYTTDLVVGWRKTYSVWCSGYSSFSTAEYLNFKIAGDACLANSNCSALYDIGCHGTKFRLCPEAFDQNPSKSGSCIHHKPGTETYQIITFC